MILAEDAILLDDVIHALTAAGVAVPGEISVAALGEVGGHRADGRTLTGFHIPREQVAAEALDLLQTLIATDPAEWPGLETQRLLLAEIEQGETLVERAS